MQNSILLRDVILTQRHFHEEFLGDFAHALQVWMHVVLEDAWLFAVLVPEHGPGIHDVLVRDARLFGNLVDHLSQVFFLLSVAIFSFEGPIVEFIS